MFGSVVMGMPDEDFEDPLEAYKHEKGYQSDTDLTAEDLKALVVKFKQIVREKKGIDFPQDPLEQLKLATEAVFKSWMGKRAIDRARFDAAEIEANPFWCPDAETAALWAEDLDALRKDGNSVGAVVEVVARGVPAGLGAPIYAKLDSELASAMMTINAVKGVEIGAGFGAASLTGVENADEISMGPDGPVYGSNQAGGVLGGISTGQDVVVRFAVKPTSSILTPRRSITREGEAVDVVTKGRHDPCVGIRAVPVGEAMMACVLLDQLLLHRGQMGEELCGKIRG